MSGSTPIARFERKYRIYPSGHIYNLGKEDWQTQTQNPNGYMKVQLSLNGVKQQFLVHQLVARHFIPNPYGHEQVNHRDGDKTNNKASNLEWVSRSENIQHSLRIGLRKGFMSQEERRPLLERVLSGEVISSVATEVGRGTESLTKMLRDQATKDGRSQEWRAAMKERRRNAAIRNLTRANAKNTERRQRQN